MSDVNMNQGSNGPGSTLDAGSPSHQPSLRAEIFLLSKQGWPDAVELSVPDQLTTRRYTAYEAFLDDLSGKVALTVLDPRLPDEKLRECVVRAIQESPHVRIAFVATDGAQLLGCEAPHDDAFVLPEEREALESTIKRLYVRAYYSATLERYYKVCFSLRDREIRLSTEDADGDEELKRLRNAQSVLRSHLRAFRQELRPEDIEAMANREQRLERLAEHSKNDSSPEAVGLPETCPGCGLDWTAWHGTRLRNGYERIGANTWRCANCGIIMADNDPENYRLA